MIIKKNASTIIKVINITLFSIVLLSVLSVYAAAPVPTIVSDSSPACDNDNHQKLSFNFQDIDIRTLLQLIAKASKLNFIISDSVKGNTTLNLKNVTWQQALDILMRSQGLASRRDGNIVYVGTIEEITTNETKKLQSDQQLSNLAPLQSTIIKLKYASVKDVEKFLKSDSGSLLTARGQVMIDPRTNSIMVRDIKKNLVDIISSIKNIDIPAKQVLIEARLVTIDTAYEEQLGIRFGVTTSGQLTGTFDASNQLRQGISNANVTPPTERLNFNNPAGNLTTDLATPATAGIALARLGDIFLDMELSALEAEEHGQIISSPHVITSNQKKAHIETGEDIPYQEATSSGATSVVFKKAVLSLEITPQITPDNKVVLHLKATEDARGQQLTNNAGTALPPIIETHEVESDVLLKDNETIVIGGVYKQTKTNSVDRIPFFGTLPAVGALFRHTAILNKREELLIFVTPKIIKSMVASAKKGSVTYTYPISKMHYKGDV